jgi:hypothetical protein
LKASSHFGELHSAHPTDESLQPLLVVTLSVPNTAETRVTERLLLTSMNGIPRAETRETEMRYREECHSHASIFEGSSLCHAMRP